MGDNPFTYGNGLNPALRPGGQLRSRKYPKALDQQPGTVPVEEDRMTSSTPSRQSFSSNEYPDVQYEEEMGEVHGDVRVRRGSEGWEVRPMSKEDIVRKYLASRGLEDDSPPPNGFHTQDVTQQPGRYNRYVPEVYDDSDSE